MRAHQPDDHMTKITAVAAEGDCPRWRYFLKWVTLGDERMQLFLQRIAGYCLTGSTRDHALFFAYGTGGNGKGVFINTLSAILAGYAAVAPMETFTASRNDRHSTELAMLRGARLVTSQETEEGRPWAEAKIKALTGGDPITARFMARDFFTYTPQFKLVIAGNHRPGLRSVDAAMRRRFNLIPFARKVTAEERDPSLAEKLREEWPGILRWAVDGCLLWQDKGLAPPDAVTEATDEYMAAEDALALWLNECCVTRKSLTTASSALFASWKTWAEQAGEDAGSQKRFSQALASRGVEPTRLAGGRMGFRGIGFRAERDERWDRRDDR